MLQEWLAAEIVLRVPLYYPSRHVPLEVLDKFELLTTPCDLVSQANWLQVLSAGGEALKATPAAASQRARKSRL